MLERELTELAYIPRWGIVRTIRQQSVAEHTCNVALFANDLAISLGLPGGLIGVVLQMALWHDMDEQFSGDLPGPNKRALLGRGKKGYDKRLDAWLRQTFSDSGKRGGKDLVYSKNVIQCIKSVVKAADALDAAVYCASEAQLGNINLVRHIAPNLNSALRYYKTACEAINRPRKLWTDVSGQMVELVRASQFEVSRGPWITGEDERDCVGHAVS